MIIFAHRQTNRQSNTNSKTEAHSILYPLWIVGGAGQQGEKLEYLPTDRQSIKQSLIQKLRPPFPLWSVDTRVAGQ